MSEQMTWAGNFDARHCIAATRSSAVGSWTAVSARARQATLGSSLLRLAAQPIDENHDAAIEDIPTDIAKTLRRVDFDMATLDSCSQEALDGLSNLLKGALFELRVAELLDSEGQVIDVVQLKATSSDFSIREALTTWPESETFLPTSEAALASVDHGMPNVIDTVILDAAIAEEVHGAHTDQVTTSLGEVADEVVPQTTFMVIAAQAAMRLTRGEQSGAVIEWAKDRAAGAGVQSLIAGTVAMACGRDVARIPAVVAGRMMESR
jgi:hypothetical protein